MAEPPRKYVHDVQTIHPDYQPPQEKSMPTDTSTLDPVIASEGMRLILEKLEKLAPSDLIRTLQGQMVTDKGEILSKIAELRTETRSEIASLRAANDTTNIALNSLDGRVKKIETRSMPPRYSSSPMPQRYDLTAAGGGLPPGQVDKLVDRLNELESNLHEVLAERDEAKKESFLAQERQGAVQKYANDKEREAKEAKEKSDAAIAAAEKEAEKKAVASEKKIDRLMLIAKLLAAAIPIAMGLVHFLH